MEKQNKFLDNTWQVVKDSAMVGATLGFLEWLYYLLFVIYSNSSELYRYLFVTQENFGTSFLLIAIVLMVLCVFICPIIYAFVFGLFGWIVIKFYNLFKQ